MCIYLLIQSICTNTRTNHNVNSHCSRRWQSDSSPLKS
jgi:hypothetical protein